MQKEEYQRCERGNDDATIMSTVDARHRDSGELERQTGDERYPRARTQLGRKQIHSDSANRELDQQDSRKDPRCRKNERQQKMERVVRAARIRVQGEPSVNPGNPPRNVPGLECLVDERVELVTTSEVVGAEDAAVRKQCRRKIDERDRQIDCPGDLPRDDQILINRIGNERCAWLRGSALLARVGAG